MSQETQQEILNSLLTKFQPNGADVTHIRLATNIYAYALLVALKTKKQELEPSTADNTLVIISTGKSDAGSEELVANNDLELYLDASKLEQSQKVYFQFGYDPSLLNIGMRRIAPRIEKQFDAIVSAEMIGTQYIVNVFSKTRGRFVKFVFTKD